jgi:phospholipase/carboxylesterase
MIYKFIEKSKDKLLIVLHGTGGDETSMIPVAEYIDEKSSVLSIRGNINENGMFRYFKRIHPGVFDVENLKIETENLKMFIDNFLDKNGFNPQNISILGYSNGANILGSLIYHYGKMFGKSILMHPMIPIKDYPIVDQQSQKILITAGDNDPLVKIDETKELGELLKSNNSDLTLKIYSYGHSVSDEELLDIKNWYNLL